MKKLFKSVATLMLLLCLFCPLTALADTGGSGNIDGGGGGMGSGTSTNTWSGGNEGVRITVVRASDHAAVTTPVDFTNKKPDNIRVHFGKVSKLSYSSGQQLAPTTSVYHYINPAQTYAPHYQHQRQQQYCRHQEIFLLGICHQTNCGCHGHELRCFNRW